MKSWNVAIIKLLEVFPADAEQIFQVCKKMAIDGTWMSGKAITTHPAVPLQAKYWLETKQKILIMTQNNRERENEKQSNMHKRNVVSDKWEIVSENQSDENSEISITPEEIRAIFDAAGFKSSKKTIPSEPVDTPQTHEDRRECVKKEKPYGSSYLEQSSNYKET